MTSGKTYNRQEKNPNQPKTENSGWDYKSFSVRMSARLEKVRRLLHGESGTPSLNNDKELYHA